MPKVIKPSNPFTNVCWVSVLTTFSAPPQILAASTVFFCLNSRNEEMMGDGFGATAAGLFWTVNVCWAHPVISRASAVVIAFFHGVIPDAFWSSQNRMCRKLTTLKQWVGNFILLIFINVCQVRWIVIIPGLTMSNSPDGELLRECPGIIKTMNTGFSVHVLHYANAPALTRKNRTLWFSVERFV